jgi:hypothetical protein
MKTTHENDFLAIAINNIGSISAAAHVAGVSPRTIGKWMDEGLGNATVDAILRLAHAARVDIHDLLRKLDAWK